jgi:hypothetical protein
MQTIEKAVGLVVTLSGLAVLLGAGVLAMRIGDTWTEATTQSLVTALATVCGGGAVVFALLVALIVGIPMATRYFAESGRARREWVDTGPALPVHRGPMPNEWGVYPPAPMITAKPDNLGAWQGGGPAVYDVWEDEPGMGQPGSDPHPRFVE